MKLKHWQGYGSVKAEKIEKTPNSIVIEVTGAHEYGLVRNDLYDAKKWLLDRFMPSVKGVDYWQFEMFVYEERWDKAVYTFRPRFGRTWRKVAA